MKIKVSDILEMISDWCDGSFRDNYSGRGMFGRKCLGIVCDNPIKIIEDAAQNGVVGAKIDSMGLESIVYWPCFNIDSEINEVKMVEMDEDETEGE